MTRPAIAAAAVFATLVALSGCVGDGVLGEPGFDWEMRPRFGLDANSDGRVDLPNSFEYVHGLPPGACRDRCQPSRPRFPVDLRVLEPGSSHRWSISGSALDESLDLELVESTLSVALPEGEYKVTLETERIGSRVRSEGRLVVDDILMVVLGDSYASGEGNPEERLMTPGLFVDGVSGLWADDGTGGTTGVADEHRRAHRSTLAGSAQAALDLERTEPHTSVTFVFLAGSGASIAPGILTPHGGVPYEAPDGSVPDLPAQLDRLAEILGCRGGTCDRVIDHLVISVGGNDMGFGQVWGGLMALDPLLSVPGTYGFLVEGLFAEAERNIAGLAAGYDTLNRALTETLEIGEVYATAYPSSARIDSGSGVELCREVAGVVVGLEIDENELRAAEARVLGPLNATVQAAADRHGWVYVDSHLDQFAAHGYCGSAPYPPETYPGNPFPQSVGRGDVVGMRWFRQAEESADIQGVPDGSFFRPDTMSTRGTLHPNEFGHQAIKAALLAAIQG